VAGLGAVLCLVGVIVVGPVVARPAVGAIGSALGRRGNATALLARRNATRNPRRTAATASALLVGVGVVTLFTVFAASLQASLDTTVDRTFGADLVVAAPGFGGAGIDPALAPALAELPEVEGAAGLGAGGARVEGEDRPVTVADPAALDRALSLDVQDGDLADLRDDQIAVAESTAEDNGWALDDPVEITWVDGARQRFTVGAVYAESDIVGGVVVPQPAYAPHTSQQLDMAVFVTLADGTGVEQGRQAITPVVERYGAPDPQDRDEYSASLTQGLDMLLSVVYALLALAIVIALMGIANTLSLSTWERRRELGVLRAVGQTRTQLKHMVRRESVLIALFGTATGLLLGVFLGWAMVNAVGNASGATSEFALPATRLVVVLVVGAVAGVLASLRPARRAARTRILASLAQE
jgi:putative ABC transport system permease protein